jgi:amino acid adenylation domain-containing protein/thioester reductase-like protein/non-ribosomal peptide synthase protein (TIGR01720 family)
MDNSVMEGFRLSPQQKHLWSLQSIDSSQLYCAQCCICIEGNLDVDLLKTALQKVIEQHEILRTTFQYLAGMTIPLQVIDERSTLSFEVHELSSLNSLEQDAIAELMAHSKRSPFHLDRSPLLQASLIKLSEQKHLLILCLPAMIADAMSIVNLVTEMSNCYATQAPDQRLSDVPIQYADYAEWQNEQLESENAAIALEFWRDQYGTTPLKLPLQKQSAPNIAFQPSVLASDVSPDLTARIKAFAENSNCSISATLLSCWQVLLSRVTGDSEITIGTAFDGRKYEELEHAIGLFARHLSMRCETHEALPFRELQQQVEQAMSDLYKWQDFFDHEQLANLVSNSCETPFFPICFEFDQRPSVFTVANLQCSIQTLSAYVDRFDIKLHCSAQENRLTLEFHYDVNKFSIEAIKRLSDQFHTLLASVIESPDTVIDDLDVLTERDRHQLLIDFNQTQTVFPNVQCIHHLIEAQAAQNPDAIAVVFEDQFLTYGQLNTQANQLAHYLQQFGVAPDVPVGLFLERSTDLIVSLLAILKAGGAYLPLDPALPAESLAFRLQDTHASTLLTQSSLAQQFPDLTAHIICVDAHHDIISQACSDNPVSAVKPANLVYILFTSGSTGKPKAVAVEHQQLFNYIYAVSDRLELQDCQSFATVSTIAADLGNTAIFPALCLGKSLHVISSERITNPDGLAAYFQLHRIDCLKIVPSHLSALLECANPQQVLPQQRLILGGETCHWQLIERVSENAPKCQIFNHYGPTETTVGALTYPIRFKQSTETVPIGYPLANTQVYVLDSQMRPVPLGAPGELYIGGAGVARGYLNRPELTRDRFIPNSFLEDSTVTQTSALSSTSLYRTGDIVRYLEDGTLEFLGRIDHQVKLRGFRIELGEIEAILRQQDAVKEAVVLLQDDRPGNKHLVAYIVPASEQTTGDDLRRVLRSQLPEYMIPAAFVLLKSLPLTPNGKVDRQALPSSEHTRTEVAQTYVAPRTQIEQQLADLWTQILGVQPIGIYDNFFELGGDSILSMQLIAKANQAGLHLTPKQLFEYQTIAKLSEISTGNSAETANSHHTIEAEQGLVTGSVPLTPIQHWFFEQMLSEPHHWNQAVLLEVRQRLNSDLLKQAVEHLLNHHDALRSRFINQQFIWQQTISHPDEEIPFTQIELSKRSPEEQRSTIETIAAEIQTSLDLTNGPLMRVILFDLGAEQPNRLLLVIHHLVVDGVSWRVLLEDLQAVYQQLNQHEDVQLPPKTTSFKHWAEQLRQYTHSSKLQQELDYWLAQSHLPIPRLPVDFEGTNTIADTCTLSVTLSVEETQTLLQTVPAAYQTQINEVLLTALLQAYTEWTGERSLYLDLEGHGREEIFDTVNLSRTVGWFTTLFPVRLSLEDSGLSTTLQAVRKQLRCIPNRGIGYGVLRYLVEAPQLKHIPQAEIRFNYLGQSDQLFSETSLFVLAQESSGQSRSPQSHRQYLLDITGIVTQGQLRLDWTYSQAIHHSSSIEDVAQRCLKELRSLITQAQVLQPSRSSQSSQRATETEVVAALNADAVLDPTIYPERPYTHPVTKPTQILLTGATGFVGAFLLHELLQQTQADIYCLVRSSDAEAALHRIQSNLASYGLWSDDRRDRIIPIVGDLAQPRLGLSEKQFKKFAEQLDAIYHNGASINLVYPYSALKASNVLGTQEILRLSSQTKSKPIHYISTLSAATAENYRGVSVVRELAHLTHLDAPYGGYAQTKWIAEKLIKAAHDRGLPVSIYRLGRVSGHSQTGVCNLNDRLYRMLKGFIQLGFTPDVDTIVDMTPVDYVTQAIAELSQCQDSLGKVFHIFNPHPIRSSDLFDWIRSFGYPLQQASNQQWQAALLKEQAHSTDNALYPLMPFFAGREANDPQQMQFSEDSFSTVEFPFDPHNTLRKQINLSLDCPPADAALLQTYFSYLIQSNFLEAPHS